VYQSNQTFTKKLYIGPTPGRTGLESELTLLGCQPKLSLHEQLLTGPTRGRKGLGSERSLLGSQPKLSLHEQLLTGTSTITAALFKAYYSSLPFPYGSVSLTKPLLYIVYRTAPRS
jgi:hypothetical protein